MCLLVSAEVDQEQLKQAKSLPAWDDVYADRHVQLVIIGRGMDSKEVRSSFWEQIIHIHPHETLWWYELYVALLRLACGGRETLRGTSNRRVLLLLTA